jgi:hypothetical protein
MHPFMTPKTTDADDRICFKRAGELAQSCNRERMADVGEKVAGRLESMKADGIPLRSTQVEKIDAVARRTFGLDSPAPGGGAVNVAVLCGARAVVQINQKNE